MGAWEKEELPSELRGAKSTPGGKQGGGWEEQRDCVTILQSRWDGDARKGHWFTSQSLEGTVAFLYPPSGRVQELQSFTFVAKVCPALLCSCSLSSLGAQVCF
ncbi:hypothetical protein EK904_000283 [Melospiza melodia maxima]|nr:hypothetical protein EK904_000283 [Melospiza melodia maxima]